MLDPILGIWINLTLKEESNSVWIEPHLCDRVSLERRKFREGRERAHGVKLRRVSAFVTPHVRIRSDVVNCQDR